MVINGKRYKLIPFINKKDVKTVNGILYVVDRKIIAYLVFESKEEQLSDYQATRKVNDIL